MNMKEYAQMLDGRQSDISLLQFTEEELQIARDNGYVIVYISSNDCIEFDGALVDEDSVQSAVFFDRDGLSDWPEDEDKPNKIEILRDEEEGMEGRIEWSFKTAIFHETFLIYMMGRKYCEGIVFSIDDLKKNYEEEEQAMQYNDLFIPDLQETVNVFLSMIEENEKLKEQVSGTKLGLEIEVFPQIWSRDELMKGELGIFKSEIFEKTGNILHTIVIKEPISQTYSVFINNFCYTVQNPNHTFLNDLKNKKMKDWKNAKKHYGAHVFDQDNRRHSIFRYHSKTGEMIPKTEIEYLNEQLKEGAKERREDAYKDLKHWMQTK